MKTIRDIIIILIISAITGFSVNALSPRGILLVGQWDKSIGVVSAGTKDEKNAHDIEIKSSGQAYEIFRKRTSLFVDARDVDLYHDGHITGAISLPVNEYGKMFQIFIHDHPFTQDIVVYCSGRDCEDSHKLAQNLIEDGYTHVRVFIDGFSVWEKEGYPVEKGN